MGIGPARSVQEIIERDYGVAVTIAENPLSSVVGTTASLIAANNPRRLGLVIVNLSANSIYIRPKAPPTSTAGILLAPNGGSMSTVMRDDLVTPSYEWYAVATAPNSAYYTLEVMII